MEPAFETPATPSTTTKAPTLTYVLVTPARNEAAFLEQTIESVVNQTYLPARWVIVSDGSTDGTDEIVEKYAARYPWIKLVRMSERKERDFAGKVGAFNAGYEQVREIDFQIIGNLDADITFEPEYFGFLLGKFAANSRLGVAGTPFREESRQYDYRFSSIEHVSGACQLFRRACFEEIGGYTPIKTGGIDLVAVITARMRGWETRSYPEKVCLHHRKVGTAKRSVWMVAFQGGKGDYLLGTHPAWESVRCVYQLSNPPFIVGGCFRFAGFFWALLTRVPKTVTPELVRFRRGEQMERLRKFLGGLFRFRLSRA